MIKALILDLDDTIFPTSSIDPLVVKPFFDSLGELNDVLTDDEMKRAKEALWKRPFHVVAKAFGFSNKMVKGSLEVLNEIAFHFTLKPYDDFACLQTLDLDKFLVTTGITKLQNAKIESLDLKKAFREILIDDPTISLGGKEALFYSIMNKYNYFPKDLLVIGDNPDSEIKAGKALGIRTLLINRELKGSWKEKNEIASLEEVIPYLNN